MTGFEGNRIDDRQDRFPHHWNLTGVVDTWVRTLKLNLDVTPLWMWRPAQPLNSNSRLYTGSTILRYFKIGEIISIKSRSLNWHRYNVAGVGGRNGNRSWKVVRYWVAILILVKLQVYQSYIRSSPYMQLIHNSYIIIISSSYIYCEWVLRVSSG